MQALGVICVRCGIRCDQPDRRPGPSSEMMRMDRPNHGIPRHELAPARRADAGRACRRVSTTESTSTSAQHSTAVVLDAGDERVASGCRCRRPAPRSRTPRGSRGTHKMPIPVAFSSGRPGSPPPRGRSACAPGRSRTVRHSSSCVLIWLDAPQLAPFARSGPSSRSTRRAASAPNTAWTAIIGSQAAACSARRRKASASLRENFAISAHERSRSRYSGRVCPSSNTRRHRRIREYVAQAVPGFEASSSSSTQQRDCPG